MAEPKPGRIGRYEILDELGRGGFGRVYRAYDPTVGRPVAIKILTQVSDETLTRFRNEATVAGNLGHGNIVTVYEYGTHEGLPFLAMEYLEGEDLHHIISSHQPLSLLEKCNIMSQVAEGLYCAHKGGVVHRDMKPANIMVLRDGTVKIMDFGIARLTRNPDATRLTQQGFLIGTLRYMAPEQLAGSGLDAQCDIFAYGVIFYEFVTGRHPFEAPDAQSLIYKVSFEEPRPIREFVPDVPEKLQQVISRSMQKNRERRYRSLQELQFDTEPIRADLRAGRAAALLIEAQELRKDNRLEPAQSLLQEALGLEPSNRVARTLWEDLQQQLQRQTRQPEMDSSLSAAEEHLAQRRFEDAVRAFESALLLDRNNVYIQGRIEHARTLVEHARKASQLLDEARRELKQQNLTAAYRIASEALRHDPKNPDATEFLKNIEAAAERRQAEQRVNEAIRKAQGLMLIPAYDEAIAVLTGLKRDAESPKVQAALERVRSEKIAHERKQRLHNEMAVATDLLRDHRLEEATKCLENLQVEFPDNREVARLLAYAHDEQAALARARVVESVAAEARARAASQDFEGALAALDRALQEYPGESVLMRLLGSTMAAKDAWERQQAVQSTLAKCELLRSQQRFAEAVETVEAALQEHSGDLALVALLDQLQSEWTQQRRSEAIRKLGEQAEKLLEQMQPDAALQAVQQALLRYPGDPALGQILKRAQDEARAQERSRMAKRAAAIDSLGRKAAALAGAGDFAGALALLDHGQRNWPDAASLNDIRKATIAGRDRHEKRQRALQELEEVKLLALRASASSETAELLSLAVRTASQYPEDPQVQSKAAEPVGLLSDMEQVRQEMARRNFKAALEICARRLAQIPDHVAFGEFQKEAERSYRRACVDEFHSRAAAEPDLRRRVQILEKGLAQYPGEAAISDELRFIRNKLRLAESIVEKARACEQSGQWDEALEKWHSLLTIYDQYPGLELEIARVRRAREKAFSAEVGNPTHPGTAIADAGQTPQRRQARIWGPTATNRIWLLAGACAVVVALAGVMLIPRLLRRPADIAVNVTANVSGTSVSVAGKNCATPNCALELTPGTYTLRAAADGYKAVTRQFTIAPRQAATKLELMLEPLAQLLQVSTNVGSGQVYLDGRREGELRDSQYTASGIEPGLHTIRIAGNGTDFQAQWRSSAGAPPELLSLTSGAGLDAIVVANAGATGSIACNCEASHITVDGAPSAQAPASAGSPVPLKGLKEGAHRIALGQRSLLVDIRANPTLNIFLSLNRNMGQTPALKKGEAKPVTFAQTPVRAYLEIDGALAGAQVKVDGERIGETNGHGAFRHEVMPGPHTIELSRADYATVRVSEQFHPGKILQLDGSRITMARAARNPLPDLKQLEAQEWARIAGSTNPDDFDEFIRNHPGSPHQERARSRAGELRQQAQINSARQLERTAWDRLDQNNKEQLQDYLSRFPVGGHAQEARTRIADIDRKAAEALTAQRLKEQKVQEQANTVVDAQAIVKVLKGFDAAYNRKDLESLQRLWNSVPVAAYRRQFREARDLKFQLQLLGQPSVSGKSATAICTRTLTYRGQSGGPQTHSERVKVMLSRDASGWLIRSIELD